MENTMLIVDDNEVNRDILEVLFSDKYVILEAKNGKEALDILQSCQGNIDVVLLDLIMPDLDGFQVLELRKDLDYFCNVPVVVITASDAIDDQIRAFDLGASDYVNKPFNPDIVVSRVDNVMASHKRMISIEIEAQKLKIKSELDQMTSLFNKTTSERAIGEILRNKSDELHTLILIDIDNFKSVNDSSGHLAGDHVIRIVADLISSLFRKSDIVGRIGGDEFIVLMNNVPSVDIVHGKVNELIQIMKYKPNLTIPENVSLSIGFASNNRCETTYKELFEKADEALYQAKDAGKAQYREYGVEPINSDADERPVALLISRNRSVCSMIQANIPMEIRILEALDLDDLTKVKEMDINKICLIYADVSDIEGDTSVFWDEYKSYPWIDMTKTIGICMEGCLKQYSKAMENGVVDILTAPIDGASFKRRTIKHLEEQIGTEVN